MGRLVGALLVVLSITSVGLSQESLAERQLRAAAELVQDGQVEQARETYQRLLDGAPRGPFADEALLALGRLSWDVDGIEGLTAELYDAKDLQAAQERFEALWNDHQGADTTAEGGWRLALLHLVPMKEYYDPAKALAILGSLPTIYPGSPRVPPALLLAAELQLQAGRLDRAREKVYDLLSRFPGCQESGRAWLVAARADFIEGNRTGALTAMGRAQLGADEAARDEALDLATLLDRIAFAPARGETPYELEISAEPLAEKAADLAVTPGGTLLAVLSRSHKIRAIDRGGARKALGGTGGAAAVAIDVWGRRWIATPGAVVSPEGRIPLPEGVEPEGLAVAGPESAWVADGKGRRVIRISRGEGVVATAALPGKASPVAVVATGEGGAWILDARQRRLTRVASDGTLLETVELETLARTPVDLARDALGHLYLLDGKAPAVLVLSPQGELILKIPLAGAGGGTLGRVLAVAVTRSGEIVLQESRKRRLGWLR